MIHAASTSAATLDSAASRTFSTSSSRTAGRAPAERRSNAEFALPRLRAARQQRGDVGAGNQQHQPDDPEQEHAQPRGAAATRFHERRDDRAALAAELRKRLGEVTNERVGLLERLLRRGPGFRRATMSNQL